MKTCFLFPGQGAQYPGMGKDLWETYDNVKNLFKLASDITEMDLKKLLFEGSEEDLGKTDKTQIAITLVNLSARQALEESGIKSDGCAGFSLGEYAAFVDSGVLSVEEVFSLVKTRGELMQKAGDNFNSDSGRPGMAAVIGLSYKDMEDLFSSPDSGVYLANYNTPTQIVLSGTAEGLTKAESLCKEKGARRFIRLKVSVPSHSPLLEEARKEFGEILAGYNFKNPIKPVYSNVKGSNIETGEEAKKLCLSQITSTVKWVDEENQIRNDGFERCLEVGPGKVLTGLWKAVGGDIKCLPAGKLEQIQTLV